MRDGLDVTFERERGKENKNERTEGKWIRRERLGPDMVAQSCGFGANAGPFAVLVLWLVSVHARSLLDRGKGGFVVGANLPRKRVSWPFKYSVHAGRRLNMACICT